VLARAALTSGLHENLAALVRINRELIGKTSQEN
jgi:hypothetical protein